MTGIDVKVRPALSNAQRRAARKASRVQARTPPPSQPGQAPPPPRIPKQETGLSWLLAKHKITVTQARAGRLYGVWWSAVAEENAAPLRSNLNGFSGESPQAHCGPVKAHGAPVAYDRVAMEVAWRMDARTKLDAARAKLDLEHLIAVLDLVCGQGKRPREITTVQRETEELATHVDIALALLVRHFDASVPGWRYDSV